MTTRTSTKTTETGALYPDTEGRVKSRADSKVVAASQDTSLVPTVTLTTATTITTLLQAPAGTRLYIQ